MGIKVDIKRKLGEFSLDIHFQTEQMCIRDSLGSVREACAKTGMSYSKGWKLIHTAEEETGWKIVERMSGGKNGGEAYITERGHMLLKKYELYRERVEAAAQDIYKDVFQDGELF